MKIRGTTITTPIKPETILLKCANLTEEQKAQVRENLGITGGGGGGDNALHVVANDERVVNYTAAEIYERLQDAGNACHVYLNWGTQIIPLTRISQSQAIFEEFIYREELEDQAEALFLARWYFGNDYQLHYEEYFVSLGGDGGSLGDIETALDSIIAIQNQLMGGDGA